MKSISLFLILFISLRLATFTQAQGVPNGDFEDWIIGGGPDLWYTNNLYWPPIECLQILADFQAYSGSICAMGVVDSCIEFSLLYPPILTSFDIILNAKPEALHGYYKYFPIGADYFSANVKLYKDSILIGEGYLRLGQEVINFTKFVVNFEYTTTDIPDIAIIEFTIDSSLVDNQLHQGSKWYIDSLSFGPISEVTTEENLLPRKYFLYQNFPNPFNPTTTITFQIPEQSFITLKLYDVLSNEIAILGDEMKESGSHQIEFDAAVLPSGIYFYKLQAVPTGRQAGDFVDTKKMIILK